MPKSSFKQIIPFPLPPYLASFFSNKINTEAITIQDGTKVKPFSIRSSSTFGKVLLRYLNKSDLPPDVKNGFTLFIEVTDCQTKIDKKIKDGRSSFLHFEDKDIEEITDFFKQLFEDYLIEYTSGARDAINRIQPTKKRGILKPAILDFCKKYGVIFTDQNIEAWKKMLQRQRNKPKPHVIKCL